MIDKLSHTTGIGRVCFASIMDWFLSPMMFVTCLFFLPFFNIISGFVVWTFWFRWYPLSQDHSSQLVLAQPLFFLLFKKRLHCSQTTFKNKFSKSFYTIFSTKEKTLLVRLEQNMVNVNYPPQFFSVVQRKGEIEKKNCEKDMKEKLSVCL